MLICTMKRAGYGDEKKMNLHNIIINDDTLVIHPL